MRFRITDPTYSYSTRNFQVIVQASTESKSNNPNLLARLRNSLVHAINKCNQLPKLIVIVLEDDIIRSMNLDELSMTAVFGRLIKWLANEYRKIIDTIKDLIPTNAKQEGFPKFIWVNPTRHINYTNNVARKKFGVCLENVVKTLDNHVALRLVHKWDFNDSNIFLKEEQRFSITGICDFWSSVDKTIEYFETKWTEHATPTKKSRSHDEGKGRLYNDPVWDHNRHRRGDRDRDRGGRGSADRHRLPHPSTYRR